MSLSGYHHGVRVTEVNTGTTTLRLTSTATIGIVGTAMAASADAFPLDTPVLFTNINKALDAIGKTGTLPKSLRAIADQCSPTLVVVRVEEGATEAETTSNVIGTNTEGKRTGIQALLTAASHLKVKPRILGVPELDTKPVADALTAAAQQLRGIAYVSAHAANTVSEALTYAEGFGQRETMVLWPDFKAWDTAEKAVVIVPAVAYALGMRAKIDKEIGWHKTISNVPINGPVGMSKDVYFDLQNPNCDTTILNEGNVTSMINMNGMRLWGSRTCSTDEFFRFESATRTAQILADTVAEGHFEFVDKPLHPSIVKDIIEGINARFRSLKAGGYILDGKAYYNAEVNTVENLKQGKLTIGYKYTPIPPLEDLGFTQEITDEYFADFAVRVSTGQ